MTTPLYKYSMVGQLITAPYQSVYWTVYQTPDTTGVNSGYFGQLQNIQIASQELLSASANSTPIVDANYIEGIPITQLVPTNGQVLAFDSVSGTLKWVSSTAVFTGGADLAGNGTTTSTNQYVSSLSYSSSSAGGPIAIKGTGTSLVVAAGNTGFNFTQAQSTTGSATQWTFTAQQAKTGSNGSGGVFNLVAGDADGSGTGGNAGLLAGATDSGVGGTAFLVGGATNSGAGGAAYVFGGAGGSGVGGSINLIAGAGLTGGDVILNTQGTTPGTVQFKQAGSRYLRFTYAGGVLAEMIADAAALGFAITQDASTTGAGVTMELAAQSALAGSTGNGGDLGFSSGQGDGAGTPGSVITLLGGADGTKLSSNSSNTAVDGRYTLSIPEVVFADGLTPIITQLAAAGPGADLTVKAQDSSGTADGPNLVLAGGTQSGSGTANGSVEVGTQLNIGVHSFQPVNGANAVNAADSSKNIQIFTTGATGGFTTTFARLIADTSLLFVRNQTSQTATISYLTGGTVTVATNTGALICSDGANLVKIGAMT